MTAPAPAGSGREPVLARKLDSMDVLELVSREGPSSLARSTRLAPAAPDGGVVIGVEAIGINFPDLLATQGLYQDAPDLPYVPGCEVAGGVVEASASSRFFVGDRVAAFVWDRSYAEQVAARDMPVMAVPAGVDPVTAAGLVVNYQAVHFALRKRGGLQPGENLLVLGAGGGIGTASLQVGAALGARVVAGVTDDAQERTARAAGAAECLRVDGTFGVQMKAVTDGRGFDVVLDPLGDRFFDEALRGLAPFGRILVVGFAAGSVPVVKVNRLLLRNASVAGVAWGASLDADPNLVHATGSELASMMAEGTVSPHVDEVVTFEEIPASLDQLSRGEIRGKAVARLAKGRQTVARSARGSPCRASEDRS